MGCEFSQLGGHPKITTFFFFLHVLIHPNLQLNFSLKGVGVQPDQYSLKTFKNFH